MACAEVVEDHAAIDPVVFRRTLGSFVTGVTVMTTIDKAGVPVGVTVNSFSSLSLDPPLVLWSQSVASGSHAVFREAGRFAVNILSEHQVELSERFARYKGNRFEGVQVLAGLGGVPLLEGCSAHLECRVVSQFPGGDHMIFVGQVERLRKGSHAPLVFGGGSYLRAAPHEWANRGGVTSHGAQERVVRIAQDTLAHVAQDLKACVALSVWGNHGPTIVRWEQPSPPVRAELRAGLVCEVTTTATGCVFASYMDTPALRRVVAAELMEMATESPESTREREARFHSLREATLATGACVLPARINSLSGVAEPIDAIGAPVFDAEDRLVAVLTAVGMRESAELCSTASIDRLQAAAARLSAQAGLRQQAPA